MGRSRCRVPWGYRNQNPEAFPYRCQQCRKQRRFRLKNDMGNHERAKHGTLSQYSVGSLINETYRLRISGHMESASPSQNVVHSRFSASSSGRSGATSYSSYNFPMTSPSIPEMFNWTKDTLMQNFQDKIEPNTEFLQKCNESVDTLVRHLHNIGLNDSKYQPKEVVKSGSLSKGTAVKDKSDIDLVVYMNDDGTNIESQRKKAIEYLEEYLKLHDKCKIDEKTPAAVKVQLRLNLTECMDVDVLPTFIYYDNPRQIYERMKYDYSFRETASAALAPLQRDFVQSKCYDKPKIKQLIRLVKYWKRTCLEDGSSKHLPTSYPLELITIGEWEDAGKPGNFDMRQGLYHVMKALQNYERIKRVWYDNYTEELTRSAGVCKGYYVIDPANPYNNVMTRCDEWDHVAIQVGKFLQQRLFHSLIPRSDWH